MYTHSSAVLLHGMGELVVLRLPAAEETLLAHVEVEALQATIPEWINIGFSDLTLW